MLTESMKKRLSAMINQDYIRERDALIPEAEKFANKQFGAQGPGGKNEKANKEYAAKWSRCFMQKMDRLWNLRKAA